MVFELFFNILVFNGGILPILEYNPKVIKLMSFLVDESWFFCRLSPVKMKFRLSWNPALVIQTCLWPIVFSQLRLIYLIK